MSQRDHPLRRLRDSRMRALRDGVSAAPVDFRWSSDLTSADSDTAFEVWLYDMIDDWFGISATGVVEALMEADGRDVLFHVNSPGGMVTEGLAIYNTIRGYEGKTTMRVEGMAASIASVIALAADEVVIEPTAMFMIHDAWDISIGPEAEHRKTADLLGKASDNLSRIYAGKAGGDAADWRATMIEEAWYVGQEAVDAKLVDALTGDTTKDDSKARWSGIFAAVPRRPAAHITEPSEPVKKTKPITIPVVAPAASATPTLEEQLAGIDLSAALRNAFPKGVTTR